jgi:hypothetical protein
VQLRAPSEARTSGACVWPLVKGGSSSDQLGEPQTQRVENAFVDFPC